VEGVTVKGRRIPWAGVRRVARGKRWVMVYEEGAGEAHAVPLAEVPNFPVFFRLLEQTPARPD
jgi:hypothetical protein